MTRGEIIAAINEIAQRHLGRTDGISEESRFIEDLRLDSLALLTLAIEVENRFRLRLDEEGVAGVETVGQLVDTIAAALAEEGRESSG